MSNITIRPNTRPNSRPIQSMVKTRVSKGANGQYKVTVPKGLAEAMDLERKRLDWKIKSGSTLEVTVVDE